MSDAPAVGINPSDAVQYSRGASYLIMQSLGMNVVQVIAFIILARLITTAQMGIFAILLLINTACQTFVTLSIDQAVIKFVAENIPAGDSLAGTSAFYQGLRATILLSAPAVAIIYLSAPFLATHLIGDPSRSILFQVLAFDTLFFSGVLPVVTAALLALRKFRETAIVTAIINGIIRQVMILSLIVVMKSLLGLVTAWIICDAATASVMLFLAIKELGPPKFNFALTRLLRFSLPLSLSSFANFAQAWFDRAMLVVFVPLATLGVYNATVTAFTVLSGISLSMSNMLFPAYSTIKDKTHGRSIGNASRLATRYVSFILVPFALGLAVTAKQALVVFVGQAYTGGTIPLMILSTAFALTVTFTTSLSPLFLALEKTRAYSAIATISVVFSVAVAYLLLPHLGIVGAASARAVSMIITAILVVVTLKRKGLFGADREAIGKSLIAGFIMVAAISATQLVADRPLLLPVYILIGGLTYLAALRTLRAVTSADMDLIHAFLGPRFALISSLLRRVLLPPEM